MPVTLPEFISQARVTRRSRSTWWALGVVGGIFVLLAVGLNFLHLQGLFQGLLNWIRATGPWAPAVFALCYLVATVCLVPASILTLGAGVLFGIVRGSIYVLISATAGAAASFLVSRYLVRNRVTRRFSSNEKFRAIDEAIGRKGWKIVGLLRLSPIFPFSLLNYALGITRVTFRDYLLASVIGMAPGTILFVYIGSLAGDLAALGTTNVRRTPFEWTFYGLGLTATIAVTIYVSRVARRALRDRIGKPSKQSSRP